MRSSSIGIIGGADGPTAIFVTGNPAGSAAVFILAAAVISVLLYMVFKKRKK